MYVVLSHHTPLPPSLPPSQQIDVVVGSVIGATIGIAIIIIAATLVIKVIGKKVRWREYNLLDD